MNEWLAARNVLAIRLDNIGDVIMLGPALRAVKETSPRVHLTLLASPGGATAAPLLPWVDDVIAWRAIWQDIGGHTSFDPAHEWKLISLLSGRGFDGALIFTSFSQTPHIPGYICYLADIPLRAGESREFGGGTLTTELRAAPDELHQVERNLRLVEHLGFIVRDRRLIIAISDCTRAAVDQLLTSNGLDPVLHSFFCIRALAHRHVATLLDAMVSSPACSSRLDGPSSWQARIRKPRWLKQLSSRLLAHIPWWEKRH